MTYFMSFIMKANHENRHIFYAQKIYMPAKRLLQVTQVYIPEIIYENNFTNFSLFLNLYIPGQNSH